MTATTIDQLDQEPVAGPTESEQTPEPHGMSKSERLLAEQVRAALRNTGYSTIGELEIEVSDGVVNLWGRVGTYYQKQLAQAVAQRVAGILGVVNRLEVICQRACRHRENDPQKAFQEGPHLSRS